MPHLLHRTVRGAVIALAGVIMLLALPALAAPLPQDSDANVIPTTTIVTSPTVVGRAKLGRTGSGSRALTLVAGLALVLGGVGVGLGIPASDRREGR